MKKLIISQERKRELNAIALNIEFLVISVIQGMALQMLAVNAIPVFSEYKTEYMLYVISGFLLILIFWSQSIIHALSFIDWPINLIHTFLYFLASFIEVITFTFLTKPLQWFIGGLVFIGISGVLYVYDFFIIRRHQHELHTCASGKKLYSHMHTFHIIEMTILVPSAILFNILAIWFIYSNPKLFINNHMHMVISAIQALFSFVLLCFSVYSFKKRSELISQT